MNIKKIILTVILSLIIIGIGAMLFSVNKNRKVIDHSKIQIVTSNFASYDFMRAIVGDSDNVEITFVLGAGKDTHSYEPTAQDIVAIQSADLFVYVGGEMEKWANKVIEASDGKHINSLCIADFVDKMDEQEIDGAEEEEEEEVDGAFDEHIWTSPANAIKMVEALEKAMENLDKDNSDKYKKNAENYIAKIKNVDSKIRNVVDNRVRDRLVFADKMPMQYFINYYGLKVTAAFPGCSTETEPAAGTIAYIERKIREENIPVVLYIELNNGRVANTIANEIGASCKPMQIQTLHNVSKEDFDRGETWVSLMERNVDVLKSALQ